MNQPNPVQYCSSNNTPASTPVPSNDILPENAHYSVLSRLVFQNGNVGAPFSRIIPGPMPPSGPAGIFCPAGSQPPLVYPIAASTGQPINAFFGPQRIHPFVQQIDRPQTVDGVPVANSNGNHLQMCQIAMQSGTFDRSSVPSEHRSTTESTDSDQQVVRLQNTGMVRVIL